MDKKKTTNNNNNNKNSNNNMAHKNKPIERTKTIKLEISFLEYIKKGQSSLTALFQENEFYVSALAFTLSAVLAIPKAATATRAKPITT